MKKFLLIGIAFLLLTPTVALAATFRAEQSGISTISSSETVKNAYLVGNTVSVNGTVSQDLIAAGNVLTITGSINDNANVAGNTVTINGDVGKSVRVVGANIIINNSIGSDLLVAGATINISPSSVVKNDLAVAGGTIDINGVINGSAYIGGGQVTINGKIDGDVTIKGSNKVVIGKNAVIGGNLNYEAQTLAQIDPGAKIKGTVSYTKIADPNSMSSQMMAAITVFSIVMMLGLFLLLMVLIYVFPKLTRNMIKASFTKPWENIGVGFIYLIVVPIASIIAICTVIGMPIGFLAIGIYFATISIAKVIVPLLVGSMIFKLFNRKSKEYRLDWLSALVGVIVATIIGLIPVVGSIFLFFVFLLALSQFARGGLSLARSQR